MGHSFLNSYRYLGLCAVALFVFLARAAGAGIVAADLFAASTLRRLVSIARSGHRRGFEFALLLAMEFLFQRIDGGGRRARGDGNLPRCSLKRWRVRSTGD